MPLDVLGRTRATMTYPTSSQHPTVLDFFGPVLLGGDPGPRGLGNQWKLRLDGDRLLELSAFNEEFLVGVGHQPTSITSLPFVHTARRSYRLDVPARPFGSDSLLVLQGVRRRLRS